MKSHLLSLAAGLIAAPLFAAGPIDPADYPAPVKVACVGDSITQGSGAGPGKSYPAQLQEMLGDKWKVGNFGVSGRTLLKKGDFPYWKEKAYQDALKFEPDVVIIMLGTNDTKPQNFQHEKEFSGDYAELVNSFQGLASEPKVFVCRPCPVPEPGNFGINDKNLQVYIKKVNALAEEMNLGVIDMHKALEDKPKLLPDRVHPNTEGAGEMAKAAFEALTGKKAPKAVAK
jgi:lysophospholipase L1-like esterase